MPAISPTPMLNRLRMLLGSLKRMIPATATMILFSEPVRLYTVAVERDMYL